MEKTVLGTAGNKSYRGYDTGEYLPKLAGSMGRLVYDQMRRSDPQVQATLKAIALPIRQAKYKIEPASDNSKDIEIAETIEQNLMHDMTLTWDDTLRHALLSLPFGFMVLEKIWELKDSKARIKKLDPRLPTSIVDNNRWIWNVDGSLKEIVQRDNSGTFYNLPIEKLLVFTTDKEGDNWEGISILRAAYKPWKIKDDAERINIINHDRHGVGIPVATMPEGVDSTSPQWKAAEETLEALYANEKSYLILPHGAVAGLLGDGKSAGTDVLSTIKYYDEMISRLMLAQFLNLGTTETGSRALGSSFIDFFLGSLQAYAEYICSVFNRFLIKEYVDYNWDVKEYPKMTVSSILKLDAFSIATLAEKGIITPDLETENAFRGEMRLPEKEEPEEPEEPELPPEIPAEGPEADETEEMPDEEEDVEEKKKQIKPIKASQILRDYDYTPIKSWLEKGDELNDKEKKEKLDGLAQATENLDIQNILKKKIKLSTKKEDYQFCDFAGMELRLNTTAQRYKDEMLVIKKVQLREIIKQFVDGRPINKIVVPLKKDMHELLMRIYQIEAQSGKDDVRKELSRQGLKLADFGKKRKYNAKQLEEIYAEYARIEIEGVASQTVSMMAKAKVNAVKTQTDVEADLRKVVVADSNWEKIVDGATNKGWGDGRFTAGQEYADEIERGTYISVMEPMGTCEICASWDGTDFDPTDRGSVPETPNPYCLGGDRCRCMDVYTFKAESAKEVY